jgi:hypothetical protein
MNKLQTCELPVAIPLGVITRSPTKNPNFFNLVGEISTLIVCPNLALQITFSQLQSY